MDRFHRTGRKALTAGVIVSTALWSLMASALVIPSSAAAAGCASGTLIKGSSSAVYYCGDDGKRYVFTNEKAFHSWYDGFSGVQTLTDSELAAIQIGGNVTYRPGKRMVKIQSDPKTYIVSNGGILRWVKDEATASCLYGHDWNKQIDDISDAFFVNYTVGDPITTCGGFDKKKEMDDSDTIDHDRGFRHGNGHGEGDHTVMPGPGFGIVLHVPSRDASSVPLNTIIRITFSGGALDATTVTTSTFMVAAGSQAVSGSTVIDGNTVRFTPAGGLQANTAYVVKLKEGIKSRQGASLSDDYSWNFSTSTAVAPAPTVLSVSPADAATGAAVTTNLSAVFSVAMDASTIDAATFTLTSASGSPIAGTVTSSSSNTATFDPSADLQAGATYTAKIATGVKSADGVPLAADKTWTFTTAAPVHVAASLLSTAPAADATGVATTTTVTATFSAAMDASTINASTFTLSSSSSAVTGTVTYAGTIATFTPSANLDAGTQYTAILSADVKDAAEAALSGGAHSWMFTTAP